MKHMASAEGKKKKKDKEKSFPFTRNTLEHRQNTVHGEQQDDLPKGLCDVLDKTLSDLLKGQREQSPQCRSVCNHRGWKGPTPQPHRWKPVQTLFAQGLMQSGRRECFLYNN